jgi:hypothetical protein
VTQNWGGLSGYPILPSLQDEAEGGWDARLPANGTDYYYQFKLTDYLHAPNAAFIARGPYSSAYYRVALHRKDRNRQHRRLKTLAQNFPQTYYAAPEIQGRDLFSQLFLDQQITQNTRLIPVKDCDDINDSEQHYITFQNGSAAWKLHSDIKNYERSYTGVDLLYKHEEALETRKIGRNSGRELYEAHVGVISEVLQDEATFFDTSIKIIEEIPEDLDSSDYFDRLSTLLTSFYGVTLIIVG